MAIVYINGIPRRVSDSAPKNYVPNTDVENSTADFTTSGPGISIARTTTGSETVRGGGSLKITTTASCTTSSYVSVALGTFDSVDTQASMRVAIDYRALTGYISGYMQIVLHDGTNEIVPTITNIPSGKGRFEAYWATTTSTSYTVRLKVSTAGAGQAFNISVDNIRIDPMTPSAVTNYIPDGDFEGGSAGHWTNSGLVTIATTTATPLRGTFSAVISASSSVSSGDYVARAFAIAEADKGNLLTLSFDYIAGAGYDAGDCSVYVRDVTNGVDITPSLSLINGSRGNHLTTFASSSTSTSYELRFKSNVSSSAWDLKVDQISVAPQDIVSAPQSEYLGPLTVTVVGNGSKVFTNTAQGWREDNKLRIKFFLQSDATASGSAGSTTFGLVLPAGYTIDTSKLPAGTGSEGSVLGFFQAWGVQTASQYDYGGNIYAVNTTTLGFLKVQDATNVFKISHLNQARIMEFFGEAVIPIVQWAGQQQYLSNSRVEHLINTNTSTSGNDTSTFDYSANGTAFVSISSAGAQVKKRVRVQYDNLTNATMLALQVSQDGVSFSDAETVFPYFEAGSQKYGMKWERVSGSTTDIDVIFGGDGANGTEAWSTYTSWKWKLVKSSNPAVIGAPAASTTREGVVTTGAQTLAGNKTLTGQLGFNKSTFVNSALLIDDGLSQYVISLSDTASTTDRTLRIGGDGGNGGVIVGRTSSADTGARGLSLYSMVHDSNTSGDMVFDSREQDNTGFATTSSDAFRFRSGSSAATTVLSGTRAGAWTVGSSVTSNPTGQAHIFHGGLNAGGTGTGVNERAFLLNANTYNPNTYARARATGIGGAAVLLRTDSTDTNGAVAFQTNLAADGATTTPTTTGQVTYQGSWTFGPSSYAGTHTANGTMASTLGFGMGGSAIAAEKVNLADGATHAFTFGGNGNSGGIFLCTLDGTSNTGVYSAILIGAGTNAPVPIFLGTSATSAKTDTGTAGNMHWFAPSSTNLSVTNRTGSSRSIHVVKIGVAYT